MQPQSIENVFVRSWDLLTRNWVIIVPGIVVGFAAGVISGGIQFVLSPAIYGDPTTVAGSVARFGANVSTALVTSVIGIAAFIITQCYVVGMAGAAWQRGTTTLADGAAALNEDAGNVFIAGLLLLVGGIIAAFLAPFTLGLSLLAFYLFAIYTLPAAIVGNRRGMDALRESFALVRARFAPTLILVICLFAITLVAGLIAGIFSAAPLLGPIVGAIISQITVCFAALVIVGEYLTLRGAAAAPPVPPVI